MPRLTMNGTVWHYTSAAGLLGIVQSNQLLASSAAVVNDKAEMTYGEELVRSVWGRLDKDTVSDSGIAFVDEALDHSLSSELLGSVYMISASTESDLLTQWVHYAGTDGFAIGIDTAQRLGYDGSNEFPREVALVEGWHVVLYDHDDQIDAADALLRFIATRAPDRPEEERIRCHLVSSSQLLLQTLVAQLKHEAFRDEREVRYVLSAGANPEFRVVAGRLKPYIAVGPIVSPAPDSDAAPANPGIRISEVKCGPTTRPGSETVVKELLDAHRLGNAPVTRSAVPYLA